MSETSKGNETRRTFLKQFATYGSGLAFAGYTSSSVGICALTAQTTLPPTSTKQIGIGLYTVRDLMADENSYRSTLAKLAEIGYKEVEPADRNDFGGRGYAGLDPKAFRALLDSNGLSMPSTHTSALEGPDLDKQFEGFQIMGIKYTEVIPPPPPPRTAAGGSVAPVSRPSGGPPPPPAKTLETVKRSVDRVNAYAEIAKRYGIKMLVRMDLDVFVPLSDNANMMPYQVIADNTDPSMVTMQIDLGWASVAGQDIVGMFKRNPGHYELWHVKDLIGVNCLTPQMNFAERRRAIYFVPVGQGRLDLKTIFASADVAGLKHIGIEQDNGATWGDSLAAARVNYNNMVKMLS
jgi:sugar phosphate isomerase/epimerase